MLDNAENPFTGYFPLPRDDVAGLLQSGDDALRQVMQASVRQFSKDKVVVQAEKPEETVYRLVSGSMARLRLLEDGRRQIISIFTPGDLLAVKAMFLPRQPDSIVCLSDSTVHTLDYKAAIKLASANSDVCFRFMWQLAEDERRLHNNVLMLGQADALERIATMLMDITGRRLKLGLNGDQVHIRQQDIADYLGLTIVHVNRTLRAMREQGAIAVKHGKIMITDREIVGRYAAPMLDVFEREACEFDVTGKVAQRG